LETGYVRLNPNQHFVGGTFFAATSCVPELHDLDPATRTLHLHEMAEVAAAVMATFRPRKMNYELLGNSLPHLHTHVMPRYADDPKPGWPFPHPEDEPAPHPEAEFRADLEALRARLG
jgi:diadenosine tetraphosphate (Ap4A) HIT family hydrolase